MTKKEIVEVQENTKSRFFPDDEFLARYSRSILYTIGGTFLIIVLLYRIVSTTHSNAERDYLSAAADFERLIDADNGATEYLENIQDVLNRRTELHPKYDGLLAQMLLLRGRVDVGTEFAKLVLERVDSRDSELFEAYSKNTLSIYEGDLQSAYKGSQKLRDDIKSLLSKQTDGSTFATLLHSYNLLRLAMLEQEIGSLEKEKRAWDEFISSIGYEGEADKPLYKQVNPHSVPLLANFQDGAVSLMDYIQGRKKLTE
jgi:hypothetical protein